MVEKKKTKKDSQKKVSESKKKDTKTPAKNNLKQKNHIEKTNDKKKQEINWGILAIIFGVALALVLLIAIAFIFFLIPIQSSTTSNTLVIEEEISFPVKMYLIEDPNCIECRADFYIEQLRNNLFPNLEVEKIDYRTEFGEFMIETSRSNFLPILVFERSIENHPEWSELYDGFDFVSTNRGDYYIFKSEYLPSKKLINNLELSENKIRIGNENSNLDIIIFSDYGCPFCALVEGNEEYQRQFSSGFEPIVPKIMEQYVDTGLASYTFINFNLLNIEFYDLHLSALCSNELGNWREFSSKLFENQQELGMKTKENRVETLADYASELGMPRDEFIDCISSEKYLDQLAYETDMAYELGIRNPPVFLINGYFISGSEDFASFERLINIALEE